MEEPKNPYTEEYNRYMRRASQHDYVNSEVFFVDANYCSGERKGWDEGFIVGNESWFNLDSENDCADWLFVFLSRLSAHVEEAFGEFSSMGRLLKDIHWLIAAADISVSPPDTDDGVWVQPFEYADEPH